jgi:mono/diheme cytochrome c family protein
VEPTGEIPVPQNRLEFFAMMDGEQGDALRASVERGHQLFSSELVGCAKCHGKEGKGDGQTNDFDDWTKDWTTSVGLDPNNAEALIPLRARGAWEPKNIYPRNFAEGIFRGGSDPNDLFLRIANGIAGTPMPAATMVEGEFSRQDIWHIINFIRSLDQSEPTEPAAAVPGLTESAMK